MLICQPRGVPIYIHGEHLCRNIRKKCVKVVAKNEKKKQVGFGVDNPNQTNHRASWTDRQK